MMISGRQFGTTTRQMLEAPPNSIYVWCDSNLHYPISLAARLGRSDLKIVPPSWLELHVMYGVKLAGIDVDHAANLSRAQWEWWKLAKERIL